MDNTPVIETERLRLRRFTERDAEALFTILSDPEVNQFLPMFPLTSLEEAGQYLKEQPGADPETSNHRFTLHYRHS